MQANNCLTCTFQPNWKKSEKHPHIEYGMCKFKPVLPKCAAYTNIRILKESPHSDCAAYILAIKQGKLFT